MWVGNAHRSLYAKRSEYSDTGLGNVALPIQEEIVKILDTFTELEGELEAELQLRQKQYKYYLNKLVCSSSICIVFV
ncbi:hypothetical protein [Helicobacter cappadocius]|uniref:hypothetical protein n=1 Tax=Helicobacter cappadocius TaxID=3063998 RepID=UPI00351EB928